MVVLQQTEVALPKATILFRGSVSMNLHEKSGLTKTLNARGTYTPPGVSRSSLGVGRNASESNTGSSERAGNVKQSL
jgi:hypothetical protein